jgi:predicted DNA-binding protein
MNLPWINAKLQEMDGAPKLKGYRSKGCGKTLPIPIRLNRNLITRLKRAARKIGGTTSSVIRLAIFHQLPQIESGRIVLAPEESR